MEMTVKEIRFRSSNKQDTIYGWIYIPSGPVKGVVQISHGMCEYIGRYHEFMRFLAQNGYIACGNDHLGHGRSCASDEQLGYFGEQDGYKFFIEDLHKFNRIVRREVEQKTVVLLGHSMGSFAARLYVCRYPNDCSAMILSGTGSKNPFVSPAVRLSSLLIRHKGSFHRSKLLHKLAFDSFNTRFKEEPSLHAWVSRDRDVVEKYENDPLCMFSFTAAGYRDLFRLNKLANTKKSFRAVSSELPILLVSGDMDPVGNYGKGVRQVAARYRKSGVQDVELRLFLQGRHEMLNETNRKDVYTAILEWLERHLSDGSNGSNEIDKIPVSGIKK